MSTVIKASIVVIACCVALSIISTVIPYWKLDAGLWTPGLADGLIYRVTDWVIAVRSLMISGTATLGVSGVLAFAFSRTHSTAANILCICLLIAGAIQLLAAMIVFAHNTPDVVYGPAFYLPLPAAVAALFASTCVHRAKRPHRIDDANYNLIG